MLCGHKRSVHLSKSQGAWYLCLKSRVYSFFFKTLPRNTPVSSTFCIPTSTEWACLLCCVFPSIWWCQCFDHVNRCVVGSHCCCSFHFLGILFHFYFGIKMRETEYFTHNRHLFLTAVEAGECEIQVLAWGVLSPSQVIRCGSILTLQRQKYKSSNSFMGPETSWLNHFPKKSLTTGPVGIVSIGSLE